MTTALLIVGYLTSVTIAALAGLLVGAIASQNHCPHPVCLVCQLQEAQR